MRRGEAHHPPKSSECCSVIIKTEGHARLGAVESETAFSSSVNGPSRIKIIVAAVPQHLVEIQEAIVIGPGIFESLRIRATLESVHEGLIMHAPHTEQQTFGRSTQSKYIEPSKSDDM